MAEEPAARPPAVAGHFYPATASGLARQVDALLDAVEVPDGAPLAQAYVVPHAGYRYSGPTAAQVYARLRPHAGRIDRVVLLGPSHYVPLTGCAVPAAARWRTPLGEIPVDVSGAQALLRDARVVADDAPHLAEHSIEVQLPFLQRILPAGVPVLPVACGQCTPDELAVTIAAALASGPAGTVLLCSTDLSHYLDEDAARAQDERTTRAVLELAAERIGVRDACGVFGLRGLVGWARLRGLRAQLLHRCTSADTAGDRSRVVGYAAFALDAQR